LLPLQLTLRCEIFRTDNNFLWKIFCCFDQGNIVVLFNGFQKKTQKTPKDQIDQAERLMKEYFGLKKQKQ